jgi:hypothetical protein
MVHSMKHNFESWMTHHTSDLSDFLFVEMSQTIKTEDIQRFEVTND